MSLITPRLPSESFDFHIINTSPSRDALLLKHLQPFRHRWKVLMAESNPPGVVDPDIFKHQKLDLSQQQIRILRLLPGEWTHPIQCSIYTVYMSTHPSYEALSYAWGDAADREPILVDDHLCEVTANLAAALRRLRRPDQERHLWVDAICINQADNDEKSHQVNLMKNIYSNAEQGLMWLGDIEEDPPSTGLALSAQNIRNLISEADALKAFSLVRHLSSGEHFVSSKITEGIQALSTFMNLAWWHRIWTVQEAILPRKITIVCGGISVNWKLLALASVKFCDHWGHCCTERHTDSEERALYTFSERVDAIQWFRERPAAMDILRTLFILFQYRSATDPRDKVFGLLGLFPWEMQHLLEADYSLSKKQVYKRIAFQRMKESRDLCPLIRGHERERQRTLPSWVPDLEAKIDEHSSDLMMAWIGTYDLFDAASGTQLELGNNIVNFLKLKGARVDEISAIKEWDSSGSRTASVDRFKGLVTFVASFEDAYPLGDTYESAFWRTLRRDCYYNPAEGAKEIYRRLHPTEFEHIPDARAVVCENENFFLTKTGLIGIGSPACRIGDEVYVLYGGKIPFILRPDRKRGRKNCYRYVGHAYVHGIMDGEAFGPTVNPEYVTLI